MTYSRTEYADGRVAEEGSLAPVRAGVSPLAATAAAVNPRPEGGPR